MKRFFTLAIMVAAFCCANAQDVQLHYDLGHSLYKNLKFSYVGNNNSRNVQT